MFQLPSRSRSSRPHSVSKFQVTGRGSRNGNGNVERADYQGGSKYLTRPSRPASGKLQWLLSRNLVLTSSLNMNDLKAHALFLFDLFMNKKDMDEFAKYLDPDVKSYHDDVCRVPEIFSHLYPLRSGPLNCSFYPQKDRAFSECLSKFQTQVRTDKNIRDHQSLELRQFSQPGTP